MQSTCCLAAVQTLYCLWGDSSVAAAVDDVLLMYQDERI
jgi:hypothetical protein